MAPKMKMVTQDKESFFKHFFPEEWNKTNFDAEIEAISNAFLNVVNCTHNFQKVAILSRFQKQQSFTIECEKHITLQNTLHYNGSLHVFEYSIIILFK